MDLNSEMLENDDHQAATRKQDHIELAFRSATSAALNDSRFNYEPMLSEHKSQLESITIFEKEFKLPSGFLQWQVEQKKRAISIVS